ncbi:hypothetical protein WMY93_025832 [Mugilogobius chulae]|uniref:C-type lectin domain-containing protein n=1 Tax=Mugilogobius chulae TaxID=88201 RepID=A0AAW0N623_9GOBI
MAQQDRHISSHKPHPHSLMGFYVLHSSAYENLLFSEAKSWSEAQSFCRQECVDLSTVHDMEEMEVLKMLEDQYEDALWIGLYKGVDLNYQWSLAGERFYGDGEKTTSTQT